MNISDINIDSLRKSGAEPHWFGLGFIQLKINKNERIHFYPAEPIFSATVQPEEIHDHRYSFLSEVLCGTLVQDTIEVIPDDRGLHEMVEVSCDIDKPIPPNTKRCFVRENGTQWIAQGGRYVIAAQAFHRARGEGDTITYVKRSQPIVDRARVVKPLDARLICPFSVKIPPKDLWEVVEAMLKKAKTGPGYHLADIPKGQLGDSSKIVEEALEFHDAMAQGVAIMGLVELSDMVGSIGHFLKKHHPTMSLEDLVKMSAVTERAFTNNRRS